MNQPLENPSRPAAWPDWKLERYLLGELPPDQARALEAAARADAGLAGRLQALRDEHRDLMAAHPASAMAAGIQRRLRVAAASAEASADAQASARDAAPAGRGADSLLARLRLSRPRAWAPAFGMILLLALLPFTPYSPFQANGPRSGDAGEGADGGRGERLKGLKPRLILHRKLAEGSVKLASGDRARAGDLIQIQYESAGRAQGVLVSLDAEGNVTRHLPEKGDRSAPLKSGGPVALGFAYELDDAAGWERFYFVTSDRPFDPALVEAALRRLRPAGSAVGAASAGAEASEPDSLPLPASFGQTVFILVKEPGT